jgi:hypothetical protein
LTERRYVILHDIWQARINSRKQPKEILSFFLETTFCLFQLLDFDIKSLLFGDLFLRPVLETRNVLLACQLSLCEVERLNQAILRDEHGVFHTFVELET